MRPSHIQFCRFSSGSSHRMSSTTQEAKDVMKIHILSFPFIHPSISAHSLLVHDPSIYTHDNSHSYIHPPQLTLQFHQEFPPPIQLK